LTNVIDGYNITLQFIHKHMELTKEYFDKQIQNLATKEDLKSLATKKELQEMEKSLKAHAVELQEELARMVSAGFDDVQKQLDVRERMKTVELKLSKIEEALHIKL